LKHCAHDLMKEPSQSSPGLTFACTRGESRTAGSHDRLKLWREGPHRVASLKVGLQAKQTQTRIREAHDAMKQPSNLAKTLAAKALVEEVYDTPGTLPSDG